MNVLRTRPMQAHFFIWKPLCPSLLTWNLVTAGSLLLQYLHTFCTLGIVDTWCKSLQSHSPHIYYKIILNKGNHYHGRHRKFSAASSYPLEITCDPSLRLPSNFLRETVYKQTRLMELGNKRLRQKGPEQVWSLQNSLSNRPFVNNTDLKLALTNKARVAVRAGTAHVGRIQWWSLGKGTASLRWTDVQVSLDIKPAFLNKMKCVKLNCRPV